MKKSVIILAVVIVTALGLSGLFFILGERAQKPHDEVTMIVQESDETRTPDWAKDKPIVIPDLGENLALGAKAQVTGVTPGFPPKNATDGNVESYWEGKAASWPNILTVDLGEEIAFRIIRLRLNPAKIWSRRTQEIAFLAGHDKNELDEILPEAAYIFDPAIGNFVTIELPKEVTARYIAVAISSNTEAPGGQIAELELFR